MTSKKDYLYERKGPWPQPSPDHPFGDAPAVVHLPKEEIKHWKKHIGLRYTWTTLTYWVVSLIYALKNKHWDRIDDPEFEYMISQTPFSKFLRAVCERDKKPSVDPEYPTPFHNIINDNPDKEYLIMDFTIMQCVEPLKGIYVAPTITLFEVVKGEKNKKAVAIYMNYDDLMLYPEDGDAWDLGKYYAIQAASHRLVVSTHALLHFPFDCINAITKTSIPKDHILFKLLYPHFDFTLVLNNTVLESSSSPIVNNQKWPFNALAGVEEGFRDMLVSDYAGIKLNNGEYNPSYPPFDWNPEPRVIHSDYEEFLGAYYEVFLTLTRGVVDYIWEDKSQLEDIKIWGDYISAWLPGFPDGERLMADKDLLAKSLAKVMWDLSVAHAADHYNYSLLSVNKVLFRIRVAPPSSKDAKFEQKELNKWTDVFRQKMEHKMFFQPANVTLLKDVDYNFGVPDLDRLQQQFLQQLRSTEVKLAEKGVKIYIPFDQISRSIQY